MFVRRIRRPVTTGSNHFGDQHMVNLYRIAHGVVVDFPGAVALTANHGDDFILGAVAQRFFVLGYRTGQREPPTFFAAHRKGGVNRYVQVIGDFTPDILTSLDFESFTANLNRAAALER